MEWIRWVTLAFGVTLIGSIVWLTIRGWVKYPEERGKGGFPFNNQIPGVPPMLFEKWLRDLPEEPAIVIPAEKMKDGEQTGSPTRSDPDAPPPAAGA